MRVANKLEQCIGYRLNVIGVRVYREYCQLVGRVDGDWTTMGPPRELPVTLPDDPAEIAADALLATVSQYERERPGTDLLDVLSRRKDFDVALNEMHRGGSRAGHAVSSSEP